MWAPIKQPWMKGERSSNPHLGTKEYGKLVDPMTATVFVSGANDPQAFKRMSPSR